MEVKVWVDGVVRVVCGITNETTVQEVVIALAQATGRTGRYTLVERVNNKDKMLPPTVKPLQVLSQYGQRSNDVQFILRRTGTSGEGSNEDTIPPERNAYRQSLPSQFKHKQRNDAVLNRREQKRKSYSENNAEPTAMIRPSATSASLDRAKYRKKKALIPPTLRSSGNDPYAKSSLNSTSPGALPKTNVIPPAFRHAEKSRSTNSIPSASRSRTPSSNSTSSAGNRQQKVAPVQREWTSSSTVIDKDVADVAKSLAKTDFSRLILEQNKHINEQTVTLNNLSLELEKLEPSYNQSNSVDLEDMQRQIERLESLVDRNEAIIKDEQSYLDSLADEASKAQAAHEEKLKYENEVDVTMGRLRNTQAHMSKINYDLESSRKRKSLMETEATRNAIRQQIQKMNEEALRLSEQMKLIENDILNVDSNILKKTQDLESINREFRQFNLQQFIKKTGSKVTVLPPNEEHPVRGILKSPKTNHSSQNQAMEKGGVWV